MNITIVGGGNIGTQTAVHCAEKGHKVIVYTSEPEKFSQILTVVDECGNVIHEGKIVQATYDESVAFSDAEYILVTLPAFCMSDIAKKIIPYAKKGMKIGIMPGTGGGECAFRECLDLGAIIFGLQRVPSVARLEEKGKRVRAVGYRDTLYVSTLPCQAAKEVQEFITSIFDIRCEILSSYLALTLTPSNPILHTTRLKTIFNDYKEGKYYKELPLFYEEWNDESSKLLFACDEEVQKICNLISEFDLIDVKSLKEHYESYTPEALTNKIRSIKGFRGLTTPSINTDKGLIPDFNSRYFAADFSYGLAIIKQVADFFNISVPNISMVMEWYNSIAPSSEGYSFADYGIYNKKDFIAFYNK